MTVQWLSDLPVKCDTCGDKLSTVFYDGRTAMGPAACMCLTCFNFGPGLGKLGQGHAQEYKKQPNGNWNKTRG